MVGRKFTIFILFYFVFEGKFQVQAPRGAYIQRGDLSEGFLRFDFGGLYLEGLIHGGAYFQNVTVERKFKVFEVNKYCDILLIFSAFFYSLCGFFLIFLWKRLVGKHIFQFLI